MVLWLDWENLFIPLHSYSYIKALLLFRDWNPDFCKLQGKLRSAGKITEFEILRVQFWTEGIKLLSVRVIGSFEISKVREIEVTSWLVSADDFSSRVARGANERVSAANE